MLLSTEVLRLARKIEKKSHVFITSKYEIIISILSQTRTSLRPRRHTSGLYSYLSWSTSTTIPRNRFTSPSQRLIQLESISLRSSALRLQRSMRQSCSFPNFIVGIKFRIQNLQGLKGGASYFSIIRFPVPFLTPDH